jgi:hypothetical protein
MTFANIGFGCYRIDNTIGEHYDALAKALTEGIDLIDTSSNYADGRSELLVGRVLSDLISADKIKREDITLVTKAGYIQGQNFKLAAKLKEEGKPFTEVVELQDGLWHCISPDFLEDQITRQLERLKTDYIDVYLLHNPEYYLDWAKESNVEIEIDAWTNCVQFQPAAIDHSFSDIYFAGSFENVFHVADSFGSSGWLYRSSGPYSVHNGNGKKNNQRSFFLGSHFHRLHAFSGCKK